MRTCLCLVACLVLAAGCNRDGREGTEAPAATAKPAATAPAAPTEPELPRPVPAQLPDVIARVNGETISARELEDAVRSYTANTGTEVRPDNRAEIYRGVLDELIAFKLLAGELKTRKIEIDPKELDAAMAELRRRFPNEAAYRRALAEQKLTVDQLRERTRQTILINQLLEQEVGDDVQVSPSEVAKFYEENPDRFQQPEAVRVSHILIAVPQGASEEQRKAAQAKAAEIAARARSGASFAALAKQHSNDASRERGGDLGFVVRGQAQKPFEEAAFALQPGEVSDPVETIYGFHVIKAAEKRPAQKVPFGQAAAQVEQYLLEQRRLEKTREFVNRLKASHRVEILI